MVDAKTTAAALVLTVVFLIFGFVPIQSISYSSKVEISKEMQANNTQYVEPPTIFTQIINRELPGNIIYEDKQCVAFTSNNPLAPVHFLVVPRKPIPLISDAEDTDQMLLGHLLLVASKVAKQQRKLDNGYRLVINNLPDNLPHLHIHVLGGRQMGWPPG